MRKRLETLVPSVWELCHANAQMFATIASLDGDTISPTLRSVPLTRLVETEIGEGRQVTSRPGAWYDSFNRRIYLCPHRMMLFLTMIVLH